jgi:hypothetical protein
MFRFAITAAAAACIAGLGTTASGADLTTQRLVTGLARPVFVCAAPGDSDRIFIVEQRSGSTGRIRVFNRTTNTLLPTPFLSVTVSTSSEQGLLGMAFSSRLRKQRVLLRQLHKLEWINSHCPVYGFFEQSKRGKLFVSTDCDDD